MGIEPTWPAWKAGALPLSYTRFSAACGLAFASTCHANANPQAAITVILHPFPSGQGGIRTPVVRSTSDLQSDAIGRSAPSPRCDPQELAVGFEPTTAGLQNRSSAVELR